MPERHQSSRVHGGAFPHPAHCRQCHYEHRCPICGNSKGYGAKAHLRHGPGRCTPQPPCDSAQIDAQRVAREVEEAVDRSSRWLFQRITDTRRDRPRGGVCGFALINEMRAFALGEATAALGAAPNIGQLLRLELAVRDLYQGLSTLCAALEGNPLGAVPDTGAQVRAILKQQGLNVNPPEGA